MQFRVRDWGMEYCQIVLHPPALVSEDSAPESTMTAVPDHSYLDVWKLAANERDYLNVSSLSWNSKPARTGISPLASIPIRHGEPESTPVFPCRSGSIQTFEFTCGSDDCDVDFWQNGQSTIPGAQPIHYASIDDLHWVH